MVNFKHLNEIIINVKIKQRKYVPKYFEDIEGTIKLTIKGDSFELENLIFEKPVKIYVSKGIEIAIKNCTFEKSLIFTEQSKENITCTDIFLFKTVVKDNINFCRWVNYKKVEIDSCAALSVNYSDNNINDVKIYHSEIDELGFEGTNLNKLSITRCYLKTIKYYDLNATHVFIDIDSVLNHYEILKRIKLNEFINNNILNSHELKIKECKKMIKSKISLNQDKTFSEFKKDLMHDIKLAKKFIVEDKMTARSHFLKYIQLIKKSKDESIDDSVISELNYLYYKNKKYPRFIYFLLYSIGFFYKPLRVLMLSVIMIVIFGIAFFSINNVGSNFPLLSEITSINILCKIFMDLFDSIYFSGITFFTIGYSDIFGTSANNIEPFRKILILLEGGIGIILTSTILISFMNKYLSRKD